MFRSVLVGVVLSVAIRSFAVMMRQNARIRNIQTSTAVTNTLERDLQKLCQVQVLDYL